MADELRTISLQLLPDMLRVIRGSSRGTSLDTHIDLISLLSLWRYWNFSCEYSLIHYVDAEPAALIINCTDPESRDAYTFHWGALPRFRQRRIALALVDACCEKLYRDGYRALYGDSIPDRPVDRYRVVRFVPLHQLMDLQAVAPAVAPDETRFDIRAIDPSSLPNIPADWQQGVHWCHRHSFLQNGAPFLKLFGAFEGNALAAYIAVLTGSTNTAIVDIRSPRSCPSAGRSLLNFVVQTCRAPFDANFVFLESYPHRLLAGSGFAVTRRYSTIYRDLEATCSSRAAAS